MERQKNLETRDRKMMRREGNESDGGKLGVWSLVGGIALVGVAALVISALPDLKRYLKISRM